MASPPEYDKEPKAPDKSATNISDEDLNFSHDSEKKQLCNLKSNTKRKRDMSKEFENLNEDGLRDLLDEVADYKSPRDIQGKSGLFVHFLSEVLIDQKVLKVKDTEEVEDTERVQDTEGVKDTEERIVRNVLPNSGSLQDLLASLPSNVHHLQSRQQAPPTSAASIVSVASTASTSSTCSTSSTVSAPAIPSSSPSTGVDNLLSMAEEPVPVITVTTYSATVQYSENSTFVTESQNSSEIEPLNRRSKQVFPMTYTTCASLEISNGGGGASSGRAVTNTTASNQVDSSIPFSCITTPEVVPSCNTTTSTSPSAVAADPKPLQLVSCYRAVASLTGEAEESLASTDGLASASSEGLTSASYAVPASTVASISRQKSLDENGNAVQGYSSPQSGSSQHKKSRRKKSSKNETVITSDQIEGHRGDKNVDELLRFIENEDYEPTAELRSKLEQRKKHKDDSDDKNGKKRSAERRREKGKIKRATSMEELSRTKLEDLTDKLEPTLRKHKKERWADVAVSGKAERRSWGDDARDAFYFRERSEPSPVAVDAVIDPANELTDFQTVTKKRKPRRRTDDGERESAAGDAPTRRPRPPSPRHARDSAPPSERSNDSNDDMDSVHSLPADAGSAAARASFGAPPAPPPPAQPLVSYAEIARTRHNIPDLIESCNFYTEGEVGVADTAAPLAPRADECPPLAPGDADGYPALEVRCGRRARDKPPPPSTARRERKERCEGARAPAECPAPDVVADRRPPVILLDSTTRPRDMDGVTFGFDINEQLLGTPARRPRCDLVRDALECAVSVPVRAGCAALRYLPPAPLADTHQLHQIIDYVSTAWEDAVRCGSGKVRYYSE